MLFKYSFHIYIFLLVFFLIHYALNFFACKLYFGYNWNIFCISYLKLHVKKIKIRIFNIFCINHASI